MRMKHIFKIQSGLKKYKQIRTSREASSIIDGSYPSIYKGRSLNFEELREYVPGDEIKDIDWKATARSRRTLVRQYIAEKKHNFLFVLDTNKRMLGEAKNGQEKKQLAITAAGTLAYLVSLNGDYISSMYMAGDKMKNYPFKTGAANIENILTNYERDVQSSNKSGVNRVLEYISGAFRRKMILVLVTDMEGFRSIPDNLLQRIMMLHDLLVILVSDTDLLGKKVYDCDEDLYLPAFFAESKTLDQKEQQRKKAIYMENCRRFEHHGIAHIIVKDDKDMDEQIARLLEMKKHKR